MLEKMTLASLLWAACLAPALAETPMTFKSVKVALPTGDRTFPGGDEADAVNENCVACHSAGMVLNQPPLTAAAWTAEVRKMIAVYKAPVADADADAVIAYLVATKAAK
jgi:mono/diheme cytochrome c family protein